MSLPDSLVNKVNKLGYSIILAVWLGFTWSIVAIKNGKKYNLLLDDKTMEVEKVFLLKYKYSHSGNRVIDVQRLLVWKKK